MRHSGSRARARRRRWHRDRESDADGAFGRVRGLPRDSYKYPMNPFDFQNFVDGLRPLRSRSQADYHSNPPLYQHEGSQGSLSDLTSNTEKNANVSSRLYSSAICVSGNPQQQLQPAIRR